MVARKTHLSHFVNFSGFENAQNLLRRGREGSGQMLKTCSEEGGRGKKRPENAHMINERSHRMT